MKSLGATFFVLLYILAMIRPVLPLFEYVINQDYIAEFLCVNKEKVELQCNGKCYLMQKLSAQNEEKKQKPPKIAMEEYPIGFVTFVSVDLPKEKIITNNSFLRYCNNYSFIYSDSNFRPPGILS